MRSAALFALLVTFVGCASTTTVHTKPAGADVYINGQRCGVSPCVYHTRYGFPDRMRVQLHKDGYEEAEFFIDTEAPVASYLLYGFGSYVFHSFDEEYRFELARLTVEPSKTESAPVISTPSSAVPPSKALMPAASPSSAPRAPSVPDEVVNQIEQCLYWGGEESSDPQRRDFLARSAARDCPLAVNVARESLAKRAPNVSMAAALVRLIAHLGDIHEANSLVSKEDREPLCNSAVVDYARRMGADPQDNYFPYLEMLCPLQHELLVGE